MNPAAMTAKPCPTCGYQIDRVERLNVENARLRRYAEHMRDRYQAHRDHFGTEGTYPHPTSVELLDAALKE